MAKIDFIKELEEIKKEFVKNASLFADKIYRNTFEINICNCYLTLRIEGEDKYGDCIVFRQEIEMEQGETYQNHLSPSEIQITQ